MKNQIRALLHSAVDELIAQGELTAEATPRSIPVEHARRQGQGDYASAIALSLAKFSAHKPRDLAALIERNLPTSSAVEKTEIAGPGFINFFVSEKALVDVVREVLERGEDYGTSDKVDADSILLEYVSANPTGPLHVGHGRGAAFGDALARLLRVAGHQVATEYYVNDVGRQMDILCVSVLLRLLQTEGRRFKMPSASYRGGYILDIVDRLKQQDIVSVNLSKVPEVTFEGKNDDAVADSLIVRFREWVGVEVFQAVRQFALDEMVGVIRRDLEQLGVTHESWFYESQVTASGELEGAIERLKQGSSLYQSAGATWFRSSDYGDEKDRVLIRSNGELTYFASDIAYHLEKLGRGHDRVINIWGADHHGYIARMKAAIEAARGDAGRLTIYLVQFATLWRGKEKIPMSTRAGEFVPLSELIDEIGRDATRFFYVLRKPDQHMDFDLELAKSQSNENPVYYVQYAHARICSVFRQLAQRGIDWDSTGDDMLLRQEVELNLVRRVSRYPEVIESAAAVFEPHQVAYYLRDLATDFHSFYNQSPILESEAPVRNARLSLIAAVAQVLKNGLGILGVSAPESM